MPTRPGTRMRVWDLPLRLVHAGFIICVAGAWLTREADRIDAHVAFGYAALGLLAFRIAWGFGGTLHARFASFAYAPGEALRYLRDAWRGRAPHYTGHNPAGSWAVYLLLAMILSIALTGIVASGGMHSMGPLAGRVDAALAGVAMRWHDLLAWALLGVVALHVAGVAWGSRVHHENLALAMVTGNKAVHDSVHAPAPMRGAVALAVALCLAAGSAAYLGWHVPAATAKQVAQNEARKAALQSTAWARECGSCHLAYPPELLPPRSWARMLREQDQHFGEDLSLSAAALARLAAEVAAPRPASWAATRLSASAPAGEAPQRITELRFWKHKHEDLPDSDFKAPRAAGRHDCEACHRDAASGTFHPRMIRIAKQKVES